MAITDDLADATGSWLAADYETCEAGGYFEEVAKRATALCFRGRASVFITKVHQLVALMNFQVGKAAKNAFSCSHQGDLQLFFSHVALS